MLSENMVADFNGLHKSLVLQVVESEFEANARIGVMTVLPGQLVVGGCIFVGLLLLHDEAHVLIGLAAGL